MKTLFILLLCTLYLSSCSKEEEQYQKIDVKEGDRFTIELEANWSTGYSWEWENRLEVSVVDTIGRVYIQSNPGVDGASGVEKWTFLGKRTGREILRFNYLKATSQDSAPPESREYLVDVHSS